MATEIEERRIAVDDLRLGMFVCRLDRPWVETPFPLQGFLIHSPEQIRELAGYCLHVCIDELKSVDTGPEPRLGSAARPPGAAKPPRRERLGPPRPIRYSNRASLEEEVPRAVEARQRAEAAAERIIEDVRAGRKLAAADVDEAVQPIVQSVLRNADAFFWISSLRRRDAYAWSHAVNCSALAAAFGRHMGFPEQVLVDLASGGLLLDVGKAELPDELLSVAGPLDAAQQQEMRRHVEYSLRIINGFGRTSDPVRHMVRTHHERHDGSGYPHGLRESQVPLFGRMAAVVDSFDALTSDRPWRPACSRHDALQQLYRQADILFQREVVEQLTQCLGVYPTGSLVELSTGEVAIVMAQNQARHLRPRVMVLTNAEKELDSRFRALDLMAQADGRPLDATIYISRTLEPGAYGLDPTELYL
jgi:HD-GYP domain-containing protein (c-di-GMP phosphodiesterase class II)